MTILIDPPLVPAHGRLWSHLSSDISYDELHVFAAGLGIPRRGFERDHYDVPAELYDAALAAGAVPVSSRELVSRISEAGLRRRKAVMLGRRRVGRPLVGPPLLRPGDTIAVVAPAGPPPVDRLEAGVALLESWGLQVRRDRQARPAYALGHLAASDQDRASDFMTAWRDPSVRAVFAARGGYGVHRMVDLLDYPGLVEAGPKLVVGFSDITVLHQAFAARLGLASVHGPVVTSLAVVSTESREALRRLLFEGGPVSVGGLEMVVGGGAEGVLVGGNLSSIAASLGTRDVRPAARSLALLEDIGEEPYRVDRLVTQLLRGGWLDDVAGIVLGEFTDCGDVRPVLEDRLGRLGVPVAWGAPFGHGTDNVAVPLGVPATLTDGTLTVGPLSR